MSEIIIPESHLELVSLVLLDTTEYDYRKISKVPQMMESMRNGWPIEMPAIWAFKGNGRFSVQDGHHRLLSAERVRMRGAPVLWIDWAAAEDLYEEGYDRLDMLELILEQRKRAGAPSVRDLLSGSSI